jgi:predicted N-acyltransferase
MAVTIEVVNGMHDVDAASWNALAGDMPLLQHAFLLAFEQSKSVGTGTGWQSCPLLLKDGEQLIGAMPLYVKYHSYGEYVFDWAWAEAFEQNGLNYYPKLLSAIPFTPVTGGRILAENIESQQLMLNALEQIMASQSLSSIHVNFPNAFSTKALAEAGWLKRNGVQFRWENKTYQDFDAFLMTLTRSKRKKIRQERKKIAADNVTVRTVKGADITLQDWQFFYQCYTHTYLEHHSTPYLTEAFFIEIGDSMPDNIVLFIAYKGDLPIASAFNIYSAHTLYGRYWGALAFVSGLHFELCYYQAQVFCIEEGIKYFEGGAQGEHKLARGFVPRPTCSFHKIDHPDFEKAIGDFVMREADGIGAYATELEERTPYKQ